ncbi:uncharacterized protein LOC119835209 [Zerene cesonia]|uniref:uncharacterized protein LOC119835209 n=1 Tax=Zerene cesonia TaxID=33412 RepID=UPI0018E56FAA|nr:uncharacterized protein LOC119835209 [Zerene cesonia]
MFNSKETSNSSKSRTPSRCREWERQRRLKFNDAISKLGDLVKSINQENGSDAGDKPGNTQYPKIEIIQKAILCLTNFTQEKSKLKAEVLALEVKLQGIEKEKHNKKDVCVQVTIGAIKNKQNSKYLKLLMLKKSKINNGSPKEKTKNEVKISPKPRKPLSQLPKLLPLTNNIKKDNTFVMVPATPYIFPQRPILFPTAPPTIVLLDTNLQPLQKQPLVNRNTNDMTKTTMVNVLPITAYSHPASATKTKRNNTKPKNVTKVTKKGIKKDKIDKSSETVISETDIKSGEAQVTESSDTDRQESSKIDPPKIIPEEPPDPLRLEENKTNDNNDPEISEPTSKELSITNKNDVDISSEQNSKSTNDQSDITQKEKTLPQCNVETTNKVPEVKSTTSGSTLIHSKTSDQKEIESKCKDNKLPTILDTSMCENVVDGGNVRLELAEEFLAASPTAAFLMSFPLVSGNRADSPTEETPQNTTVKENTCRTDLQPQNYFDKSSTNNKSKSTSKSQNLTNDVNKTINSDKVQNDKIFIKPVNTKSPTITSSSNVTNENPFLNLPTIISTTCTLTDAAFGLDFDCNISKTTSQPTNYVSSNNLFYKSDPFGAVKNTVYSTSSLSSGHEFNGLGLYPCAVENYTSKNKTDFPNIEDNLMKINTSRLTYDIDLGWSHKSLDFVNCTTNSNTLHKDNIFTSTAPTYTSAYNPFNPEFHVSLSNPVKKDMLPTKTTFSEAITSFYSQPGNLWSDDVTSIYTNSTSNKNLPTKQNHYSTADINQTNTLKTSVPKHYKHMPGPVDNNIKPNTTVAENQHNNIPDKYTKKSPSKMHINWMTSETRSSQNNCDPMHGEVKENYKPSYGQSSITTKKNIQSDNNYFPINMHHFPSQANHEELQMWPSAKPAGTAEISIEPPPIHLPTLVGDLALGPHDKKRNDILNRASHQTADQTCTNFLSVTQLMNRSSDNMSARSHGAAIETKSNVKHILNQTVTDNSRKSMNHRTEINPQQCYGFNDAKVSNQFEPLNQFSHTKSKNNKSEKNSKMQKNNYSAEALIRGGTCNQKAGDHTNTKFMVPPQKFCDFNIAQDSSVAQVSHYPPILDYSENSYAGQQYSSTTLYNTTANTIPNSFYSNFMQSGSNLMATSYTGGPFTGDFIDYNNQSIECNYSNAKYDDTKARNNPSYQHDKTTRRDAAKHKLECTKKETSKKYPTKRAKLNAESDDWVENNHLLWQNKTAHKRHGNMISEELQFPNFVSNQMPTQYQPDFFNSHLMPANVQNVGHASDRSVSTFPVASRGNFNLSALFPEITMKVQ